MKNFSAILILLVLITLNGNLNAQFSDNISTGIEVSYRQPNKLSIFLRYMQECASDTVASNLTVQIASSCGDTFNLTLQGSQYWWSPVFCYNQTTCGGGTLPGKRFYIFTGHTTLPNTCNEWKVSYFECCRDTTINLLGTPSLYTSTTFFTGIQSNYSPTVLFGHYYLCKGALSRFSLRPYDSEGDSVVYSFTSPKQNENSNVVFNPGFSFTSPIPGISLDSLTGVIELTPLVQGDFAMAITYKEYKKGTNTLVSKTNTEITLTVLECPINAQPIPQGITNLQGNATLISPDTIHVNLGDSFSFEIEVTDADTADSVTIFTQASAVLPGVTITTLNGNPAKLNIAWRAPSSPNNTRVVHITAADDVCATPGIGIGIYTIIIGTGINSINKTPKDLGITIYPNPVQETLHIDLGKNPSVTVEIISLRGEVLLKKRYTSNNFDIDLSNYSTGFYLVKFTTKKGIEFKRIVKN